METIFEWDTIKAKSNFKKHRVSFETAVRAFADPWALIELDRVEDGEERWQTLGLVDGRLLLLVAHTINDDEDDTELIRIISARHASPKEKKHYEEENGSL
ncbi:MAG: BrnT family toxin [Candidatus Adiutrix sp.]|jgi:uncharacterized DUF497 family protein|nr:BrnT family toxin [Candidatus Adiutrix sp.]